MKIVNARKGDHLFCIYPDQITEFSAAVNFLGNGLDKNELIMLISDYMPIKQLREKLSQEWKVDTGKLVRNVDLIIRTVKENYFPNGFLNETSVIGYLEELARYSARKGKAGVRIFASNHSVFENGLSEQFINYESSLDPTFKRPITAICAYKRKDVDTLSDEQFEDLVNHHVKTIEYDNVQN